MTDLIGSRFLLTNMNAESLLVPAGGSRIKDATGRIRRHSN
jgi:hypothetical protein